MSRLDTNKRLSCSDCGVFNCRSQDKSFPQFCLTTGADKAEIEETVELYRGDSEVGRIARASAEIEGRYYGKLTRVEEIIAFAKRLGAKKIGIATCFGLIRETKIFAQILEAKGLASFSVLCKVGGIDKNQIGIPDELKVNKGCHESLCNPIMQARLLNKEQTDLNVINGLCVGHDTLFIKYSQAPITTLITKDRVTGHNPAVALYTSGSFYKRLLQEEKDE